MSFNTLGCRGYSLYQLMVSLAIIAFGMGVAVPGLSELIQDSRRTRQVNLFVHSVHLAKSEAHKRAQFVSLCKSPDGEQCTGAGPWSDGWIVFVNRDKDDPARVDRGEEILYTHRKWENGLITGNRQTFSFRPFRKRSTNGTFIFCDRRGSRAARAVIVSYTGRPRASDRAPNGSALVCPD
ncbi:MAG: GspH/FimT family pseudopilin [Gammaproteobacteria bacterium]|nr:GspH/FimT family pseudopilin [Gammaproteobacteria bacterium]